MARLATAIAYRKAADSVIDAAHRLYVRGMNSTMSGNVSARTGPDTMLITPAGYDKASIGIAQLSAVRISSESKARANGPDPSSEFRVHTRIYAAMPGVNALVHPHPPYSLSVISARGAGSIEALASSEDEYAYYVGMVGVVRGKAGSVGLADAVASEVQRGATVVIMENHGTVGIGASMHEALGRVEALEHMAKRYYIAQMLRR